MKTYHVDFFVNGEEYELDVPANKTALNVIRDMLDLTGAKEGCGAGECAGECTAQHTGENPVLFHGYRSFRGVGWVSCFNRGRCLVVQ